MNLITVTFSALLLFSAYADITLSHTNEDNQTFLLEFMAPTADPSSNEIRMEITITSQYAFFPSYQIGAICTTTGPDGIFPDDVNSNVFVPTITCSDSSGCISGTLPRMDLRTGSVIGKNSFLEIYTMYRFLFKSYSYHSFKNIGGILSLDT